MNAVNIHQMVASDELTMTSLEIAQLTSKRYNNVLRKIRYLAAGGIIRSFDQIEQKYEGTSKGRPMKLCRLNNEWFCYESARSGY